MVGDSLLPAMKKTPRTTRMMRVLFGTPTSFLTTLTRHGSLCLELIGRMGDIQILQTILMRGGKPNRQMYALIMRFVNVLCAKQRVGPAICGQSESARGEPACNLKARNLMLTSMYDAASMGGRGDVPG